MACQVEIINGNGIDDRDSSSDNESNLEIITLKQTLKQKILNENLNGNFNGDLESASSSTSKNDAIENGHSDDKLNTDSENELDAGTLTPKKSVKGKKVKGKKEKATSPKSKRHTPIKKIHVVIEEVEAPGPSWENVELINKNVEDETIDVGNEDSAVVVEDDYPFQENEFRVNSSDEQVKEPEGSSSVFSRLRDSMRFSISPRKEEPSSSFGSQIGSEGKYLFRTISGRRALYQNYPHFGSNEAEAVVAKKRKAETENCDAPQQKYFMTSFSERSPGWKFFSSPFTRFWSPKKTAADSTVTTSHIRELHEEVEDSLAVNVDESVAVDDLEIETEQEEINDMDQKPVIKDANSKEASWKCIVM